MKNDFRDYDYLFHSLWKKHKYIRKEGNKYIYSEKDDPEVKKAKARDRSYKVRNLISKITGNNKRFLKNVTMKQADGSRLFKGNINDYRYERAQRDARKTYGKLLNKKEREARQMENSKKNKIYYDKALQKKIADKNRSKIAYNKIEKQARSQGASAAEKRKQDNLKKITDFVNSAYSNAKKRKKDKENAKKEGLRNVTNAIAKIRDYRKNKKSKRR